MKTSRVYVSSINENIAIALNVNKHDFIGRYISNLFHRRVLIISLVTRTRLSNWISDSMP